MYSTTVSQGKLPEQLRRFREDLVTFTCHRGIEFHKGINLSFIVLRMGLHLYNLVRFKYQYTRKV